MAQGRNRNDQIESLRRLRTGLLSPMPEQQAHADEPQRATGRDGQVVHHHHTFVAVAPAKSTGLSYLLWFFLGGLGAHRFYLGRTGSGVAQLLLLTLGWLPLFMGWLVLGCWWLIDLFLIPGIAREENERAAARLVAPRDAGRLRY